jgi:hypothetical protein
MRRFYFVLVTGLLAGACGLEANNLGRHGFGDTTLAITNAEGERDVLRTGTALSLSTPQGVTLAADAIYNVKLTNLRTGELLSEADVLTDTEGKLEHTAVAHDLGEFDNVEDNDSLRLVMVGPNSDTVVDTSLPVTPHIPDFQGHGFQVDEVQPAHVMTCDKDGTAVNGFVVGALPDANETAAPIFVKGRGFAKGVTTVDIYVVKDRDKWSGRAIPRVGDSDFVAGPVVGTVQGGVLAPTAITGWTPTGSELGPYDVLVDVDRNGTYEFGFSIKDASDGEDKVGLTIQYGAAWWRAKSAAEAAEDSVQAASDAYTAADAAATKAEAAAKGPDALALAAQARDHANKAKAELATATAAADKARTAFQQSLADDATAEAESSIADAAGKKAADHATKAANLVNDTVQATKAWQAQMKALAAQMAAKHLLVNLAYDSSSRSGGTWANTYSASSGGAVYTYVNPPVQSGPRHAWVNKYVIPHQSWKQFWNNWELIEKGGPGLGRLRIKDLALTTLSGSLQRSCTNAPPMKIINPKTLPIQTVNVLQYDIVFDYDRDGYYDVGRDFLDVVSWSTSGNVVSAKELSNMADDQIFGFQVTQ